MNGNGSGNQYCHQKQAASDNPQLATLPLPTHIGPGPTLSANPPKRALSFKWRRARAAAGFSSAGLLSTSGHLLAVVLRGSFRCDTARRKQRSRLHQVADRKQRVRERVAKACCAVWIVSDAAAVSTHALILIS